MLLFFPLICLYQIQLDNLQIYSDGKITMNTALAFQTVRRWERNGRFATMVTERAGGRDNYMVEPGYSTSEMDL